MPSYVAVIGYGPGALFWYIAIICLWCIEEQDTGASVSLLAGFALAGIVSLAFVGQIVWRAAYANESERVNVPFYVAKRGIICSTKAIPLPIAFQQPALRLEIVQSEIVQDKYLVESFKRQWLDALHGWNIAAIQFEGVEYRDAPKDSPESRKPPFMISGPITSPARYTLRVEGGPPYTNNTQPYSETVLLTIIDNHSKQKIGYLTHHLQMNNRLGYCPQLTPFSRTYRSYYRFEEARKWLMPFIL